MPYQPIIGTLGYVQSVNLNEVLMIHRNTRADDQHLGKYNGLGGKLEPGEDVAHGMIREIQEEAGIAVSQMQLRGTVNWPGFGVNGEDWLGFIFLISGWRGDVHAHTTEGSLHWIAKDRLLQACSPDDAIRARAALPMWPGDPYFLPLVFDADLRPFHGVMPYANGHPTGWNATRM